MPFARRVPLGPSVLPLVVVGAAFLTACKPATPEEALARNRSAIEQKLAAIRALASKVKDLPPITADFAQLAGPPPCFVDHGDGAWNAVSLLDVDLADPTSEVAFPGRLEGYQLVRTMARHLSTGKRPLLRDGDEYPEKFLIDLACSFPSLRYLLVIRVLEHASGEYTGDETFRPGRQRGEARLFDLETGAPVAAFTYQAESRSSVSSRLGAHQANVDADLLLSAMAAVKEGVLRVIPGARAHTNNLF